ncbi:MAG: RtcB family protein [Pseudomonadota bacterium]
MNERCWLADPLSVDVTRVVARLRRAEDVQHIAIMPDVHLANEVCVGMVVATTHVLFPAAVGSDIGCGMAALRFDRAASTLADGALAAKLLDGLERAVPKRRWSRKAAPAMPDELGTGSLSHSHLESIRDGDGRLELATLGSGNHFVELQADEEDALWLMLHSGSRCMGPAIRHHHEIAAARSCSGLVYLEVDSPDGQAYLADVAWASRYAAASRQHMVERVAALLEETIQAHAIQESFFSCEHNHVRRELHGGKELWVHRKGAIHAGAGEPGIVPGSMGTPSFHVQGRGNPESLCSSSHGAGRSMSRSEARRAVSARRLADEMDGIWYDHRLGSGLRDEAPSAYRDIGKVMRAQRDLVRIVRRLRPVLSFKGV